MSLNFILDNGHSQKAAPWVDLRCRSLTTEIPVVGADADYIRGIEIEESPNDQDILRYNAISQTWKNVPLPSGGGSGDLVYVNVKEDFPAPVGDIIQLVDGITYLITDLIDMGTTQIRTAPNSTLTGISYMSSGFISDYVGTFIDVQGNLTIQSLKIQCSGKKTRAIEISAPTGYIFVDKVDIMDAEAGIKVNSCSFLNIAYSRISDSTHGILLDGTIFTSFIVFCQFYTCTTCIGGTPTISNRLYFNNCLFSVGAGETGLDINNLSTIPTEGYILNSNLFVGVGTYLSANNITRLDNRSRYTENRPIENSAEFGQISKPTSAEITVIGNTTNYFAVTGTGSTLTPESQRFTGTNTSLTYVGGVSKGFLIQVTLSVSPQLAIGNNDILYFGVAKSTDLQNPTGVIQVNTDVVGAPVCISLAGVLMLIQNETVQLVVRNTTLANNMIISSFSITATPITF